MRSLSAAALAAIHVEETGEVFLPLLTISNVGTAQPLRFVADTSDLVSRGNTFLGCPFQISLPVDKEDELGRVVLQIDNVDRAIVSAIRTIETVPQITLEIVLASSPDTLEAGPFSFSLREVSYDSLLVQGQLMYEDILNETYPQHEYTPSNAPGLF